MVYIPDYLYLSLSRMEGKTAFLPYSLPQKSIFNETTCFFSGVPLALE